MTEQEPDNVLYLDEYPEIKKRVELRRAELERQLGSTLFMKLYLFPDPPDEPA